MSRFDDLYSAAAAPLMFEWFGGSVEYEFADLGVKKQIEKAIVGEERKRRRRAGEYEVELVTVRSVSIGIDEDQSHYSGISEPQENALVRITEAGVLKSYVIEEVLGPTGGMAELKLRRVKIAKIGSRESLGE